MLSIILFVSLINIQKVIINKNELGIVYVLNTNLEPYTQITKDMYDIFYVSNKDINKYSYITDESILNNMISIKQLQKGIILTNDILINKEQKQEYINKNEKEVVLINIDNYDKKIGKVLNDNNYINLYITVNTTYIPNNIHKLRKVEFKSEKVNQITFLYLEKFSTYSLLYDDEVTKNNLSSIVLEVTREQATYINSIKDIADFSISVI
ncbi:MAG: hypothetical protein E7311_03665 [Clostridiales bacterium]|nr:hypothetical protein [Clostridiales bacterium]